MQGEWFRLETLQNYIGESPDNPSLLAWLNGEETESIRLMEAWDDNAWTTRCQKKMDAEVQFNRIHIVEEPYSPYVAWEIEAYKRANTRLGENVFLLPRQALGSLAVLHGQVLPDLTIFDDTHVVASTYGKRYIDGVGYDGYCTDQTFYDTQDAAFKDYLAAKQNLMQHPALQPITALM
jgi:hypothetical protein